MHTEMNSNKTTIIYEKVWLEEKLHPEEHMVLG